MRVGRARAHLLLDLWSTCPVVAPSAACRTISLWRDLLPNASKLKNITCSRNKSHKSIVTDNNMRTDQSTRKWERIVYYFGIVLCAHKALVFSLFFFLLIMPTCCIYEISCHVMHSLEHFVVNIVLVCVFYFSFGAIQIFRFKYADPNIYISVDYRSI